MPSWFEEYIKEEKDNREKERERGSEKFQRRCHEKHR